MIDPLNETLISITEATKLLPGRPNVNAIWRWRTSGIRGVKLETVLIGGRRFTSREALQRFIQRTTAAEDGEPIPTRTKRQRDRQRVSAKRELKEAGILS